MSPSRSSGRTKVWGNGWLVCTISHQECGAECTQGRDNDNAAAELSRGGEVMTGLQTPILKLCFNVKYESLKCSYLISFKHSTYRTLEWDKIRDWLAFMTSVRLKLRGLLPGWHRVCQWLQARDEDSYYRDTQTHQSVIYVCQPFVTKMSAASAPLLATRLVSVALLLAHLIWNRQALCGILEVLQSKAST